MTAAQLRNLMIARLCASGQFTAEEVGQVFGLQAQQVHRVCRDNRRQARSAEQRALAQARARVAQEIARNSQPVTPDKARQLVAAGKVYGSPAVHPLGPHVLAYDVALYGGGERR